MKCWYCGNSNFEAKVDDHGHPYDLCLECGASTVPMAKIEPPGAEQHIDSAYSKKLGHRVVTGSPSRSYQRKVAKYRQKSLPEK
uniref:Uncharacterized protein n=1 Tax=viral metagenome TaxID=1070528 RepID=A0A6H1ZQ20_9ZZZZ